MFSKLELSESGLSVVITFINNAKQIPTVRHNLSLKMCELENAQRRILRTITDSSL